MNSRNGRVHANQQRLRRALVTPTIVVLSACILLAGSGAIVTGNIQLQVPGQLPTSGSASEDGIWQHVDRTTLAARTERSSPRSYQAIELNTEALSRLLSQAPMEFTEATKTTQVVVNLPMPDGTFGRFRIEESPAMDEALAVQFPEVKSYRGQGLDDPTATARFDWSPLGFHALVLSANGSAHVEPYTEGDTRLYITFYKQDLQDGFDPPQCEVTETMQASRELRDSISSKLAGSDVELAASVGTSLRTYRLALATTVEYTNNSTYGGGKPATLTKLNTIVNLINAIYEREVSIRFQLVSGELSIIFDAEPDGYTNSSVGTMLNENPTVLTNQIGASAYDVGHVFGLSGAGSSSGVAQIGVVCGASKGRAASVLGIALVTGNFSIDSGLVSHEFGHQFSAGHTFNSTSNLCSGQRSAATAFEPGSGSTLMAYPGICSPENLQSNSDSYFLGGSFDQIANYASSTGAACAAATATGNNPAAVSAGLDYTVPIGTPFTLTATGTDPDGDALTYSWEELDLGNPSPPMTDDGTRPLFRSFPAVTNPSRTFPKLSNILNNTSTIGELLPVTTRAMNFRVTARDNRAAGGGVNSDAMVLSVTSGAGPFVVTSPNSALTWTGGSSQMVTWNVANTSSSPVGCTNVRISLSTDGGNTFPIDLAASTPNDGSETLTVPNIATTNARVKITSVGNVFFDVSNANFTIVQGSGSGSDTIGLFRPAGNLFFLRNSNTFGSPDSIISFGAPADLPIVGDWDGNATATIGLYRPTTSTFFLRNTNTVGAPDIIVSFGDGPGGDLPVVGDWDGNGTWTLGVYRPSTSTFILRNSNTFGQPDIIVSFGAPGDMPIVGDWDGNGTMTVGLFRPSGNLFILRNSNTLGQPDIIVSFGGSGDLPIVGDWDGNGTTTMGLFRPSGNLFILRNSNTFGQPDIIVAFGAPGDKPIVGNWDGL